MIDPAILSGIGLALGGPGEPEAAEGFGDLIVTAMAAATLPQSPVVDVAVPVEQLTDPSLELLDGLSTATDPVAALEGGLASLTTGLATDQAADGLAAKQARAERGGLPAQALAGKTASAAFHASAAAQASALSAVRLSIEPSEGGESTITDGVGVSDPQATTATANAQSVVALPDAAAAAATQAIAGAGQASTPASDNPSARTPASQAEAGQAVAALAASKSARAEQADTEPAAIDELTATPPSRAAGVRSGQEEHARLTALGRSQASEQAIHAPTAAAGGNNAGATAVEGSLLPPSTLAGVLRAVEALEHAPPPRTMAIDVPGDGPGADALRLVVTLRGDVVHVTSANGLPPQWGRDLAAAFAQRGLSLAADGEQGSPQQNRNGNEPQAQPRAVTADARASRRVNDGALRL